MEFNLKTLTESCEKYKRLRFPLKIWILVNATGNRFLYWDPTESFILVDPVAMEPYLSSDESIFPFTKLSTFFWLMDCNGFELSGDIGTGKVILQYRHSSFTRDNRTYFEQLMRRQGEREVMGLQRGNCAVHRTQISHSLGSCGTNLSDKPQYRLAYNALAQEKYDLYMEIKTLNSSVREAYGNLMQSDDGLLPIIEVPEKYGDEPVADPPVYMRKRKIAGNYGQRATVEHLKRFFANYIPVYEDTVDTMETETAEEQPEEKSSDIASEKEVTNEPTIEMEIHATLEEQPSEVPTVADQLPEPINTLETFDYPKEDPDTIKSSDQENFPPVMFDGMDLLDPTYDCGGIDKSKDIAQASDIGTNSMEVETTYGQDEEQFQLYTDIRETFELLNQI
ncbi:uncharacterized protein LOC134225083 [Armigeres subalbatus]|uniref:uncharacterized protein LOC134225083 n=1 Tax=Armigeres subalbatus TaxID=124917 RepID=UPI002ECFCEC0